MVDDVSRIKYSCSQVAETVSDETKQLDFYFLYKIDAEVDSKVELNRLQVAYVYNLASKLLPCAGDEDSNKGSKSNDHLFTVVAIDSAKQDELLEIELCEEGGSDTAASDHLCHMVDGSISIIYSIIGNNTSTADIEGLVSSQVTTTLHDVFAEPSPQPNSLGASLIMPITTTPPDYLISENIGRKIVSPTTVASFCAGLFATIALIYLTKRKYHSRIEGRNKRSEEGGDSTPRRPLRRIGILSPRGGQNYLDLDDNILPDSSGTEMASGFQANAFNFEPVLAATTSTESESVSLSAEPSTFASIQSPASSDSSCPFDDLPEDDSRSYGSVDLDCSVIGDGDGDLSTIYEEPTFSHSVSF